MKHCMWFDRCSGDVFAEKIWGTIDYWVKEINEVNKGCLTTCRVNNKLCSFKVIPNDNHKVIQNCLSYLNIVAISHPSTSHCSWVKGHMRVAEQTMAGIMPVAVSYSFAACCGMKGKRSALRCGKCQGWWGHPSWHCSRPLWQSACGRLSKTAHSHAVLWDCTLFLDRFLFPTVSQQNTEFMKFFGS